MSSPEAIQTKVETKVESTVPGKFGVAFDDGDSRAGEKEGRHLKIRLGSIVSEGSFGLSEIYGRSSWPISIAKKNGEGIRIKVDKDQLKVYITTREKKGK